MRKSLWILLAVLWVAIGAPNAHADSVTLDVSGSLSPVAGDGGSCPTVCTLGGDVVIDNTAGTVTSVDITVAGASPSVGPFDLSPSFFSPKSTLFSDDLLGDELLLFLSGTSGTLVGYTGGAILDGTILDASSNDLYTVNTGALTEVTAAPEPSSIVLMLLGLALVVVMRKRIGQGLPQAS